MKELRQIVNETCSSMRALTEQLDRETAFMDELNESMLRIIEENDKLLKRLKGEE